MQRVLFFLNEICFFIANGISTSKIIITTVIFYGIVMTMTEND